MPDHLRHRGEPRETSRPDHSAEGVRRGAFTILELLVVLMIVAFVCLVLFPAVMNRSAKPALRTRCAQNLHGDNVGWIAWSNDHDGCFPWQVPATNGGTMDFIPSGNVFP